MISYFIKKNIQERRENYQKRTQILTLGNPLKIFLTNKRNNRIIRSISKRKKVEKLSFNE